MPNLEPVSEESSTTELKRSSLLNGGRKYFQPSLFSIPGPPTDDSYSHGLEFGKESDDVDKVFKLTPIDYKSVSYLS